MLEWIYILNSDELGELQLTHSPIGWDGADFVLKRSKDFDGVFYNYSLNELEFTGNGYTYLHELFKLQNINFNCSITVKRWNIYTRLYTIQYTGILNGRSFKYSSKSGRSILLKIGESSVQESILSRMDNVVNYDDDISMDGSTLPTLTRKYSTLNISGNNFITGAEGRVQKSILDGDTESNDYGLIGFGFPVNNNDNIREVYASTFDEWYKIADGGWLYNTREREAKVILNFSAKLNSRNSSWLSYIRFYKADILYPDNGDIPVFLENRVLLFEDSFTTYKDIIITDLEINLTANQAIFVMAVTPSHQVNVYISPYLLSGGASVVTLDVSELPTTKKIQAIQPFNLFSRIISSITDNAGTFESDYLGLDQANNGFGEVMHFNGFMARGFSNEKSAFAISLKDMFNSWKIIANCGLSVNGNVVKIERRSDFFSNEIILTIDNVKDKTFEKSIKEGLFYSQIVAGYNKTEYKEDSGLEEYNNKSEYTTSVKNVKGKLQLTPKLRGDGYGITFAIDKDIDSTDTQFDKDNFFCDSVKLGTTGEYVQKNYRANWTVNGLDGIASPINLDFTPAKIVIINSDKLTGINERLKFTKAVVENDVATKTQYSSNFVKECKDIEQYNLKDKLKSGFEIVFDWSLNFEVFSYLVVNRYGLIQVKNPISKEYNYGWIEQIKLNKNNEASFILHEKSDSIVPEKTKVMSTHNLDFVVTNNDNKISVL